MMVPDPSWQKYQATCNTRQGVHGTLTLPGEWNGFTCWIYGTDQSETGRKMIDWWHRDYPDDMRVWRTGPFSDDLIYSYIYQKSVDETIKFLDAVGQKMTVEDSYKSKTDIFKDGAKAFLRGKEIYIAAAFFACVALGGSDG